MPKNLTDVDTFTSPIVVPVDTDPADAASVEVGFQGLANRTHNLNERLHNSGDDEWTYPSPKARIVEIPPVVGVQATIPNTSDWQSSARYDLSSAGNGSLLFFDLGAYVPSGCVITDIEVMVKPGAARSLGSRMFLVVTRGDPDWGTPGSPTVTDLVQVQDDGTTNDQILSASSSGSWSDITVDRSANGLVLQVQAGADGGAHVPDEVNGIRVHFDDIGPRNA